MTKWAVPCLRCSDTWHGEIEQPNELSLGLKYRRPVTGTKLDSVASFLAKRQVHLKPRNQTGQLERTTTAVLSFRFLYHQVFIGKFLSYHFATLETIMSDSDCINEVVATTSTTQYNRRGSIEKFDDDPPTPIPIPTPSVPPPLRPRSTFKSIVLVLTVTFAMIINVGCLAAVA